MSASVAEHRRQWVSTGGAVSKTDKVCTECGAQFFTSVGLSDHEQRGCGNGHGSPVKVRRLRSLTPEGREQLRQCGLSVTARNNARRIQCNECGKVSTPSGIALHQGATAHVGRTELT